jgi:hypothetical protein
VTVTVTKPVTLDANWIKQYYLAIISPAGSPWGEGWYSAGTVVTVGVQSVVLYPNETRMMFTGWNSTSISNNPATQITVNAPVRIRAVWKTQYLVTVNSEYGTPLGGGWYDVGSSAKTSVPVDVDYTNGTRRVFAGWTGDYLGASNAVTLVVNAPKTVNAQWETQYLVTFAVTGLPNSTSLKLNLNNVTSQLSAGSIYQTWVPDGASINPTLNATITGGIMGYKFTGWRNSTGSIVQNPLRVDAPSTYLASYTPQLSLPPIPGFPIEAIIAGLALGLAVGVYKRRLRARKNRESI